MDYIDWVRMFTRLLHTILTLHNRQYYGQGYLDLADLWKRLFALWGRLPHSKLTLSNQRYCLRGYLFLDEMDSYENPLGEGYHTHLTLCTQQHCFPIHLSGPE